MAAISLAACAGAPPLETGLPQTVRIKQAKDNQFSNRNISIRSDRTAEDGTKFEVPGAVCGGQNAWFAFPAITTPAGVQMPTFLQGERFANRGLPPELTVACKLDAPDLTPAHLDFVSTFGLRTHRVSREIIAAFGFPAGTT